MSTSRGRRAARGRPAPPEAPGGRSHGRVRSGRASRRHGGGRSHRRDGWHRRHRGGRRGRSNGSVRSNRSIRSPRGIRRHRRHRRTGRLGTCRGGRALGARQKRRSQDRRQRRCHVEPRSHRGLRDRLPPDRHVVRLERHVVAVRRRGADRRQPGLLRPAGRLARLLLGLLPKRLSEPHRDRRIRQGRGRRGRPVHDRDVLSVTERRGRSLREAPPALPGSIDRHRAMIVR